MLPARTSPTGLLARGLHELRLFFVALQFFTRLPIPRWVGFEAEWLHHASRYFPAVGLVVGGIAAMVYALAAALWPHVVAILWQLAWVVIFLKLASRLFRRSVLKSGPSRATKRKPARA